MNILFLGDNEKILNFLKFRSSNVIQSQDKINIDFLLDNNIVFFVSYGYRYIISEDVVEFFKNKIINLHISYLPWNRGASPNLWSIIDNTKKGITIHYIDKKLDTGDIIVQKELEFDEDISLRESYNTLRNEIEILFMKNWILIVNNKLDIKQQNLSKGTFNTVKATNKLMDKLNIDSWDISIKEVKNKYKELKNDNR